MSRLASRTEPIASNAGGGHSAKSALYLSALKQLWPATDHEYSTPRPQVRHRHPRRAARGSLAPSGARLRSRRFGGNVFGLMLISEVTGGKLGPIFLLSVTARRRSPSVKMPSRRRSASTIVCRAQACPPLLDQRTGTGWRPRRMLGMCSPVCMMSASAAAGADRACPAGCVRGEIFGRELRFEQGDCQRIAYDERRGRARCGSCAERAKASSDTLGGRSAPPISTGQRRPLPPVITISGFWRFDHRENRQQLVGRSPYSTVPARRSLVRDRCPGRHDCASPRGSPVKNGRSVRGSDLACDVP